MSECTCGAGGSKCSASCSGGAQYESCGTCGGTCSGANCGANCGPCGGCGYSCGDGCSGNCGSTCNKGCAKVCGENCEGGCMTECGSYCTGQAQAENFKNLKLEKKFVADNIEFISNFIDYEIQRRGIDPLELDFSKKERLDEVKMNKIISKLREADSTIDISKVINIADAVEKKRGLKTFGESIIEKATVLYQTDFQIKTE